MQHVEVERWDLAGPFPEGIGLAPAAYRGGFGARLATFAQRSGGKMVASADMACVAREGGRFILAREAAPPRGLARHIAGRCGSPAVQHRLLTLAGEVPAAASEEEVLEHWKGQFDQMLGKLSSGVPQSVGTSLISEPA